MARPTKSSAKSKKRKLADLPSQPDPRAPVDGELLVRSLQPLRKQLEADLLNRAKASAEVTAALKHRHAAEKEGERTAANFATWQRAFVEQVAAAWILSSVFVRTLEDRDLLEQRRIAGPGALDSQRSFLQLAPSLTEREYLLTVFREMTRLPAAAALFDDHNPVWMLAPSAEGAKALLQYFRTASEEAPALRFGQSSTRFLGDLYQDLNENVRKRYALLQTPDFIEEFILDRTLEPAIEKFGLDEANLIDPTCGSGHFMLGAFDRFFDHIRRAKPALTVRQAATEALDKVYGADINPFAAAIAKFRLTLSFLEKGDYTKLSDAPALPLHVAVADSLLYNPQHQQQSFAHLEGVDSTAWEKRAFDFEDEAEARAVLHRQYAAVVGNPPYITVKDKALRDRYRELYASAHRSYSLAVPFCERFFQLARQGGRTGQITANSFMKREFGKKLIEEYLPTVNLDLIVNTSGAYIPGHGTPTVLLFGSHDEPQADDVLTVLAKRGEPTTPDDPAQGLVWSSIVEHWDDDDFDDDYITVAQVERESLADHPWSLAGGGANKLKQVLEERCDTTLGTLVEAIGFGAVTREDDVYLLGDEATLERWHIPSVHRRRLMAGEHVRDWACGQEPDAIWPYDPECLEPAPDPQITKALWPWRTQLADRVAYGKTQLERGLPWFAYSMFFADRFRTPLTITFAFVATHNHFVLDRGGKVFKQSAPIIKLPETATEEDHLALLAYLNSSTACFWMKQVFSPKGMNNASLSNSTPFLVRFEFDGTKLSRLPLPTPWEQWSPRFARLGQLADRLAQRRAGLSFDRIVGDGEAVETVMRAAQQERERLRDRLVAVQEEIDWLTYAAFGLAPLELYKDIAHEPAIPVGGRAFELAFEEDDPIGQDWFRWHESSKSPPKDLPSAYATRILPNRVAAVKSGELGLLEAPECKRRFIQPAGKAAQELEKDDKILHDQAEQWMRDRVEGALFDAEATLKKLREVRGIILDNGPLANTVLYLRRGIPPDLKWYRSLLDEEAVPYLAALRYKQPGLEKRAAWERTWDLQRREDAGEDVGDIPVPPKYSSKDFRSGDYYKLRGKLDVPKERFISYPGCESDEDGEPVYGWAGWDHAQRAQALVALYNDRKTREGWAKDRLTPMLAGVLELLPWLKQWHDEPMPEYDTTFFEAYAAFLNNELRELELTRDDLRAWRPPEKTRGRRRS